MNTKPLIRSATIGLALAALAAPAAGAQQDLRNADQVSPAATEEQDLRNADQVSPAATEGQDLRNADQVSPAATEEQDLSNTDQAVSATEPQDLRSPDAIDAGAGRDPSPDVVYVAAPSHVPADGLDWADAGIGAGGLLGLGLIALGGTLVVIRHRHPTSVR
jgi:hypothetical protein